MTKEEAVARAIWSEREKTFPERARRDPDYLDGETGAWSRVAADARAAIAAADKWDAEQRQPAISQGFDDALQAELDHPPASILGKE